MTNKPISGVRLMGVNRIREIAEGHQAIVGERETLAATALHFIYECRAMGEAFKEAGLMLFAAQDHIAALEQQLAAERARVPVAWYSKQYGTVWIKQLCQMGVGTEWFIRGSADPVAVVKSSCSVLWNVSQKDLPHGTVFYALLPVEGE